MNNEKCCNCGNILTKVPSSPLFSECFYCKKCDKIFKYAIKEVTEEWFRKNYTSDRFLQICNLAKKIDDENKDSLNKIN